MQSVQNRVASSWAKAKLVLSRHHKLQTRIQEIARCGNGNKNNNLPKFQCQGVPPAAGSVDRKQAFLTSKGLAFYTFSGSFDVEKYTGTGAIQRSLLRPNPTVFQVSCRAFGTLPDKQAEKIRTRNLSHRFKNKLFGPQITLTKGDKSTSETTYLTPTKIIVECMVNPAALRAAFEGAKSVVKTSLFVMGDLLLGAEIKTTIPEDETLVAAYHEGGRALVALCTKHANPLHRVTIIPQRSSMGYTSFLPTKEQYHMHKQQLLAQMDVLMGGMAAVELAFEKGATYNVEQVISIATHIVGKWGVSKKVGVRLGAIRNDENASTAAELVNEEISRLLLESYDRGNAIVLKYAKELITLTEALTQYGTLDAKDVKYLVFQGRPPSPS